MKKIILSIFILLPYILLVYIYTNKNDYIYKECMDINQSKTVKDVLGGDLELLRAAGTDEDNILEVAKLRKAKEQEEFCRKMLR